MRHSTTDAEILGQTGYFKNTFIGKVFNGNEGLFEKAKAEKEVWQCQVTGKWYFTEHTKRKTEEITERVEGALQIESRCQEEFDSVMTGLTQELGRGVLQDRWIKMTEQQPKKTQLAIANCDHATDAYMKMLQDAHRY